MPVSAFVDLVRGLRLPGAVANPYAGWTAGVDAGPWAPATRCAQLHDYLDIRRGVARTVLVGEAPGYRGARFTGVPMTSERLLAGPDRAQVLGEGQWCRTSAPEVCRSEAERAGGLAEPTATVVWQALSEAGMERSTVLWNAFPLHPHQRERPLSNRRPTGPELDATDAVLPCLLSLFPGARVVAVGTVARDRLAALGFQAATVRHPAFGGAAAFRAGMRTHLPRR